MSKIYDYVLFDFDGTIADTSAGIFNTFDFVKSVISGRDVPRSEYKKLIGPPLSYSFKEYFGLPESEIPSAIKIFREQYAKKGLFECAMYEGLRELFETLSKNGKKLFVATSKPEAYAKKLLAHFGVAHYFAYVGGSDIEETRAKKSEIIEYVLAAAGIEDKSRAVMVGDRVFDVNGAKEAGLDCIGVLFGFGNRSELEDAGAIAIAKTPADIAHIILQK